jgi:FkbM family methyltransferase
MNDSIRKLVRTALVYLPFLREMKPLVQRTLHNFFSTPFEIEFEALKFFPELDNAMYLDVGGNYGLAIDAIRIAKPSCRIISFEPNQLLAERTRRLFQKNKNVLVHSFGLGEGDSELPLFIPIYRGAPFFGLASFYRTHAASSMNGNQFFFFDERKVEILESISKIKPLDSLNLNPFFIKLDVQGYELAVLKGGRETICRSKPVILIESVNEEHVDFLRPFGYRVYCYDRKNHSLKKNTEGKVNSFLLTDDKYEMIIASRQE